MYNWSFMFTWRPVPQKKPVTAPASQWWAETELHGFGSCALPYMSKKILHCIQVLLQCKILGASSVHFSLLCRDVKTARGTGTGKAYFPHKLGTLIECLPPWYAFGKWRLSGKQRKGFICDKFSLMKAALLSRQIWALCCFWTVQRGCVSVEVLSIFPISTVNTYHGMHKLCYQMLPDPSLRGRDVWLSHIFVSILINERSAHTWISCVPW